MEATIKHGAFSFTGTVEFSGPYDESDGAIINEGYDAPSSYFEANKADILQKIEDAAYDALQTARDDAFDEAHYEDEQGGDWFARTSEDWATYRAETGYAQ
tara:strand:+ start:585 stop:887 length:303 start_codon:yes stop_codon:yes gene_type:complete